MSPVSLVGGAESRKCRRPLVVRSDGIQGIQLASVPLVVLDGDTIRLPIILPGEA